MSSLAQSSQVKHVLELVTVINTLVFSKLIYCSTEWSNTSNKNICRLKSVQNFAMHIITGTRKFDHINPRIRRSRLASSEIKFFCDAVIAFKCMSGQVPCYLSYQFTTRIVVTGRMTRSCQLLNIPKYKLTAGQRSFYYWMVHICYKLDNTLKTTKSISTLKFT